MRACASVSIVVCMRVLQPNKCNSDTFRRHSLNGFYCSHYFVWINSLDLATYIHHHAKQHRKLNFSTDNKMNFFNKFPIVRSIQKYKIECNQINGYSHGFAWLWKLSLNASSRSFVCITIASVFVCVAERIHNHWHVLILKLRCAHLVARLATSQTNN